MVNEIIALFRTAIICVIQNIFVSHVSTSMSLFVTYLFVLIQRIWIICTPLLDFSHDSCAMTWFNGSFKSEQNRSNIHQKSLDSTRHLLLHLAFLSTLYSNAFWRFFEWDSSLCAKGAIKLYWRLRSILIRSIVKDQFQSISTFSWIFCWCKFFQNILLSSKNVIFSTSLLFWAILWNIFSKWIY